MVVLTVIEPIFLIANAYTAVALRMLTRLVNTRKPPVQLTATAHEIYFVTLIVTIALLFI